MVKALEEIVPVKIEGDESKALLELISAEAIETSDELLAACTSCAGCNTGAPTCVSCVCVSTGIYEVGKGYAENEKPTTNYKI